VTHPPCCSRCRYKGKHFRAESLALTRDQTTSLATSTPLTSRPCLLDTRESFVSTLTPDALYHDGDVVLRFPWGQDYLAHVTSLPSLALPFWRQYIDLVFGNIARPCGFIGSVQPDSWSRNFAARSSNTEALRKSLFFPLSAHLEAPPKLGICTSRYLLKIRMPIVPPASTPSAAIL